MLFSLGVAAFVVWNAAAPWLIVSTPFVWFFGRRWLLIVHVALIACHVAVFLAVRLQTWIPPGGDHDVYVTLAKRYFGLPILSLDIVVLAWWSRSGRPRFSMPAISAVVGLWIAVFVGALWASFVWLQTIPLTITNRAGSAAKSRPFCLVVGGRPAERPSQLAIGRLENAFASGIEYYGYYALLKIDGEATERNWSFRAGDFLTASPLFRVDCSAVPGGFLHQ